MLTLLRLYRVHLAVRRGELGERTRRRIYNRLTGHLTGRPFR